MGDGCVGGEYQARWSVDGAVRHVVLLVLAVLPSVGFAAECEEPAPLKPVVPSAADPALVTWTAGTRFPAYPPEVPLVSKAARAERARRLEARLPGFTAGFEETGRLLSLTSRRLPCRFTTGELPAMPDPWFQEVAWTLEQAAWDALGHAAPPTLQQRSWTRVTFDFEGTGEAAVRTFTVWFYSDARPVPRAGRELPPETLRAKLGACRLEAVRATCPPCTQGPPGASSEGSCQCVWFVLARRPCAEHVTFQVLDHYIDKGGKRRFVRVAMPNVDQAGFPPPGEGAAWQVAGKPLPYLDAVTGTSLMDRWDRLPQPVPVQAGPQAPGSLMP